MSPSEKLENDYNGVKRSFQRLLDEATYAISHSITEAAIKTHSILGRVKDFDSIVTKAHRKDIANPLTDLEDLVGLRVVCLLRSDIIKLEEIAKSQFKILSEDNKIDGGAVEAFGYQSVHFICQLKDSNQGPRYTGLHDIKFELQIRTLAMDAWASLSHYLDYKSEADVPKNLRKDFYALSGLFYVADTHFEIFYESRQKSKQSEKIKAKKGAKLDEEINLDNFSAYLVQNFPERIHLELSEISDLLTEMISAGYKTFGQLKLALDAAKEAFNKYESKSTIDGGKFADVGVIRISLALADENFSKNIIYQKNTLLEHCRQFVKPYKAPVVMDKRPTLLINKPDSAKRR